MKREVHSGSEIAESCSNSVIFYSRAFLRLMGGIDDLWIVQGGSVLSSKRQTNDPES
jgi:hypothetical protein